MANPIQFDKYKMPEHPDCRRCEELLTDAVDEVLEDADRVWFERHVAGCMDCQQALEEAQRGAAWLTLLKAPRPEPSAQLLARIFAETDVRGDGMPADRFADRVADHFPVPVRPNVLPFRPRMPQLPAMGRMMFEPRLAMTAAMAFFSIALTMNLTGVRLDQMHAADLKPAAIKRTYYEATASVARRYEGLRVVHVVESRVDDLRIGNGNDSLLPESRRGEGMDREQGRPAETVPKDEPKREAPSKPHGISQQDLPGAPRVVRVDLTVQGMKKTGGLA